MSKQRVSSELAISIKASRTGDVPLEIYDALYYSGKFEPIYRIQGDMVLGAYFSPAGSRDSRLRKIGHRIMKELTIEVERKPRGQEIRIENLMPVFEEEKSFYRDPRVRISCKSQSDTRGASITGTILQQRTLLEETEKVLLQVRDLKPMDEARLTLTLHDSAFDVARLKEADTALKNNGMISSASKRSWSLNFNRLLLTDVVIPELIQVLSTMTIHG
ncbi:MAG: hypothetical protein KIS30_01460 [Thermoplasmata archaeon]|nr:hypothetical protein [Candidatus Sysuiplasma acidicola]MBX8637037.1 hypothetical protein [Candidatus Sysuiplasma acidicola]MBX8645414.1 hypothetical protein [Candidatus Sysuiplasma acidicola]